MVFVVLGSQLKALNIQMGTATLHQVKKRFQLAFGLSEGCK